MHRWSAARLLALVALIVLIPLDLVLLPPVLSTVKSFAPLRAATTPASIATPGTTARPAATTPPPTPQGPTPITAAYNNTGIGLDGADDADFDGLSNSYSEQALTAVGFPAGTAVTSGGVQYVMPDVPAGRRDNVKASGQTILAPDLAGASLLGFLGAAEGGDASGTVTITYTDGTTQTETLTFSDWTLGGGTSSPQPDSLIAVTSAYRDSGTGRDQTSTYVFASLPIHLQAGKAIQWVRLPDTTTGGTMHVFSIGTDKGVFS